MPSRAALFLAVFSLLVALDSLANELVVDSRRLQRNDLLTITLSLEGSFASLDDPTIPTTNLVIAGEPSVSSEFAWVNGVVSRRKILRYRARALAEGPAVVGPVQLRAPDGQIETLPGIEILIVPDRVSASNEAEVVLRELLASGREPLFVVAESSATNVYVGEPVIVTWFLYNAASVQQWNVVAVPKLPEFWTEELARNETPERLYVGDVLMQRLAIRRAALFPLRSGTFRVEGMSIQAAVMKPGRRGPFSRFEGELVESTFTSAPLDVSAKAIPPGPAVEAAGDLALTCAPAVQRNGGPVVVTVSLTGTGNVRAAQPPRMEGPVDGTLLIEGGEVTVSKEEASFGMGREWRYLIFPRRSGLLEIPPLTLRIFVPATSERRELRCESAFVQAVTSPPPRAGQSSPGDAAPQPAPRWPWLVAGLAILAGSFVPAAKRELQLRRQARELVRDASPAQIRTRIEERLRIDLREASDRGDAWRALRSLLDAAEHDRDIADSSSKEVERRVVELLRMVRE